MQIDVLSPKQRQIFEFAKSENSFLIADGAVRSGKTMCMSVAFVLWAMANFNDCTFAICGKTVGSAERNIIVPLMAVDGIKNKCTYHRSDRYLEVKLNGRTNRFYVFGGKDESSYTLLQGITLAGVLLDEVALMPQSFVNQALARTFTYPNKKIWFNCNPEGTLHWFNVEWVQKADNGERQGVTHLHFLMDDNPIMTPEAIAQATREFSGVFYQRYILGLWVVAEGIVYDMFDNAQHIVDGVETEGDYFISSDFGIQNATVFLLWRKERGSERWICENEYYYSGRENKIQKTVEQLVEGMETILQRMEDGTIIQPRQIVVDPSAAALIVALRRKGYHVVPAVNDVLDGISDVSTMLKQNRLALDRRCKNTINEFGVYAWDSKAAARGIDAPVKENDHAMDAIRYFVKTKNLVRIPKPYQPRFF